MNPIVKLFLNTARFALAFVLSFLFFVGIAKLHAMIDLGQKEAEEQKGKKKVLVEMIRKEEKPKEKKTVSRVRKVQQRSNENKLGGKSMDKFMPGIEDIAAGDGEPGAGVVQVKEASDTQAEVFEEGETDEPPIPLAMMPIAYPMDARERGIEGKLVVYFIIGHNGKIKSIDVVKSPSPIITREAKRTIRKWRFKPGMKNGIPVNVRAKKEIDFVLQK